MDSFLDVVQPNLLPILIALLIGLVVGWWIFARARSTPPRLRETPPTVRARPADAGSDGVADAGAVAVADVVREVIGTDVEAELPAASGPPDNLQTLKGVGPKLAAMLHDRGITRFDQLAALRPEQVARLDAGLGAFSGRLTRDRVVEQAGYLARGDRDGFQATFGNLGGSGPGGPS
jgi:predicted flap endonuclease-1-like 5' DNA nuclease